MKRQEGACCFTGHWGIPEDRRAALTQELKKTIRWMVVEEDVRYFVVGGALGFDALAADVLFDLRDWEFPEIRVILVYPFRGYTSRWTPEQQREQDERLPRYDQVVRASETPSREAYLLRNRMMVDTTDRCIAYCSRPSGGTAYTVRYAQKSGLPVINLAERPSMKDNG